MDVRTLKTLYHFEKEQDLSYKSNAFVRNLEDLERLAVKLNALVSDETSSSKGKIIKKINQTIEEDMRNCQLYYNASRNSMKNSAKEYTELVNDMRAQHMTLHYEVIEMNK